MRFLLFICLVCVFLMLVPNAYAQVPVNLLPNPRMQFFNAAGQPLAGGLVYTYISGTTTPQASYVDSTGLILNSNPVVLDSGGFASIWLTSGLIYRITVADTNNVQQWSVDGVQPPPNLLGPGPIGTQTPNVVEATYFLTSSANPALSGVVRLASADQFCWRNNANSADLCLSKNGADVLNWPSAFTATGNGIFANVSTAGQFTSTVLGSPPLVVSSTLLVPNLNANFLQNATWAAPPNIGNTTPASGLFTILQGGTSVQIGTSTPLTGNTGNGVLATTGLASVTSAVAGKGVCADGSGNIKATGCQLYTNWGVNLACPSVTGTGTIVTCTITLNATEADTAYKAVCTGGGTITGYPLLLGVSSKGTTNLVITYTNGTASEAVTSSWGEVDCIITR